jgi:polyhydroxyalkanoate synthesis regulator phasin
MNREVGEMKGARSALDEKLQDLKGELGSHGQEQAKQVESLNGRIDRLDRRIDGLSGGAAQAHVRLGVVRP